jgi:hypothetical protein
MFYRRHHDLGNHYIISISLMTTDILMTSDMFYGRHNDLVNRYIISVTQVMVATVEHICGHK